MEVYKQEKRGTQCCSPINVVLVALKGLDVVILQEYHRYTDC